MATLPTEQAPGYFRRRVGTRVVTAVNDGMAVGNFDPMVGLPVPEAEAVLRDVFRGVAPTYTFNTFVVQDGTRTTLIDTGGGGLMGPVAGRLLGNLAAAGITPGEIDAILLTHLHIDHVGGLTDAAGAAVFTRAEVFVAEADAAFWLDADRAAQAPEPMKPAFAVAQASVAPYTARLNRFTGPEPVPGIRAEHLPGHTPGHTGYRIPGDEGGLLIWGDIVHLPDIQSRRPEVGVAYDVDPVQAIATRRRVFDMAARDRLLVAGMHMHFPALSHVARAAEGYALVPVQWTPEPRRRRCSIFRASASTGADRGDPQRPGAGARGCVLAGRPDWGDHHPGRAGRQAANAPTTIDRGDASMGGTNMMTRARLLAGVVGLDVATKDNAAPFLE